MKTNELSIVVCTVALLLAVSASARADRVEVDLSGPGWRLLQDGEASWEDDSLYLRPVDLSQLPNNPPTHGWASLTDEAGVPVSVPGTTEEYLGDDGDPSSDVKGVTWWYRQVAVPANDSQRITLQFESARQRAEIYVDGKLVGYDLVGNTPFEVDLTGLGLAGKTIQLAVRLWVDGKQGIDDWGIHAYREQQSVPIQLDAGMPVQLKLEFFQAGGESKCLLKWSVPAADPPDPETLIQRAVNDGTTILLLDDPETWLDLIQKHSDVKANGAFDVGMNWLGGQFFARRHPLLAGLPVDCAMNWPYQRVVRAGATWTGLRLEGEQFVTGAYESWPMALGTAIGVIRCGKGKVVVSTLDVCGALDDTDSTAEVARKMLCNYIRFASATGDE